MSKFAEKIVPKVKADSEEEEAEIVCPQETLREKCKVDDHHVESLLSRYQECNDRVNSKSKTAETCEEELFDYIHALDHCVAKTLWSKLK